MAIQDDKTILSKQDLKEYHNRILPYLGGNMMMNTNNSDYYSTDEKVVGIWTDGKPVYQKTIETTLPSAVGTDKFADIGATVDTIVDIRAQALRNNNYSCSVNGCCVLGDFTLAVRVSASNNNASSNKNKVVFVVNKEQFIGQPISVTLQYTKTTDSANAALTTPGAYDINFPNTWPAKKEIYFGNGLYGRRCTGNLPATAVNSACTVNLFSSQTSSTKIVNMGGSFNTLGVHDNSYSLGYLTQDTSPFNLITNAVLFYSSSKVMRLRITTGPYTSLTTDNTYDVWVTYKK